MKVYFVALGLMFLAGCQAMDSDNVNDTIKTDTLDYNVATAGDSLYNGGGINSGLPVKKLVIASANGIHEFEVEVAITDDERRDGLMNRETLADNRGMLFIFDRSGYMKFWMKNTLISLDMFFIDNTGIVQHIVHSAPPCTTKKDADCPKFNSDASVKYVLEINGGLSAKYDLKEGDKVTWL
jgi:uncharacterized protein